MFATYCFVTEIWEAGITKTEAVLTSTHNLCFGAKNEKYVYPCRSQFCYIKVGFKGVYLSRACFPDGDDGHLFQGS